MSVGTGSLSKAQIRKLANELSKAGRDLNKLTSTHEKVIKLVERDSPKVAARVRKLLGR